MSAHDPEHPSEHSPEQSIARLMKLSGERDKPSPERASQARTAAKESWQRMLTQTRKPVWQRFWQERWVPISLALAVGLVFLLVMSRGIAPAVIVARVNAVEGVTPVTVGEEIRSGQQLVTENSRVALTLGDSLSLRIDQHTTLRLDGKGRVSLLQGRVYVDSGGLNVGTPLVIVTPAGEVRHIGTQFQVTVENNATQVQVREGRVQLSAPDSSQQPVAVAAGEALQIVGSLTKLQQGLPTYGADWEWSTSIASTFDIENKPMAEFLTWLAREHGWQLRYATESLQQRTHEIRLHGSFESLSSNDAMERLSLITGVPISSRDGVLLVGNKKVDQ